MRDPCPIPPRDAIARHSPFEGWGFGGANPQLWAKVDISKSQPWPHNPLFGVVVENSNNNNNNDDDEEEGKRTDSTPLGVSGASEPGLTSRPLI